MVGQQMAQWIYMSITLSNINQFFKLFHGRNQEKMCSNTITEDPATPHMCCYTTWLNVRHRTQTGDDTDLLHKINVDQAWPVAVKQPGLTSGRLCCLGCLSKDDLSTVHVKQSVEAGDRHWVEQSQHLVLNIV